MHFARNNNNAIMIIVGIENIVWCVTISGCYAWGNHFCCSVSDVIVAVGTEMPNVDEEIHMAMNLMNVIGCGLDGNCDCFCGVFSPELSAAIVCCLYFSVMLSTHRRYSISA